MLTVKQSSAQPSEETVMLLRLPSTNVMTSICMTTCHAQVSMVCYTKYTMHDADMILELHCAFHTWLRPSCHIGAGVLYLVSGASP